jgi:PmbA protein
MCRAAADEYGMGYSYAYSLGYDIDFFTVGEQAKEKALSQLGKEKTESGDKNVILVPKVFSSLLVHAAIPSFLGHNVVEGRSSLQIGQEVASHSIQVTENPLLETPLGRSFDDEGVPSQKVELLQDGCVRAFLYDTYYGKTTSNGVRYARYRGRNLRDPPKPSATSLVVTGEPSPLDDIISEVSHGLLVVDETNSHASKTQSGLFSIAVTSGFIINHGEILAPVKRCMISGLAFEDLLPGITSMSEERELHRSSVYPTYVETGHALVDSLRVTA